METSEIPVPTTKISLPQPEAHPLPKTDYAAFLRVKILERKTVGKDGTEITKHRESTVLSNQGKEMARKVFHKMSEGGFDATQTWLERIRKDIEEYTRLPVDQKNLSPEQRIFYGKLLRSCEMQLRNNQIVGIKEELATTGNLWMSVARKQAQMTGRSEKFVKNYLTAQINKHRIQLIGSLKAETKFDSAKINKAARLAEQSLLLATPDISDPLQILLSPQIKTKTLEFLQPPTKKVAIGEIIGVLDGLKSKTFEGIKGRKFRTRLGIRFAQVAVAAGLFFGTITAGPQVFESGKTALGKIGSEGTNTISIVVKSADDVYRSAGLYFDNLTRIQEQQYAENHSLEALQPPEPTKEAPHQPPTVTPSPTPQPPSPEQQWREKERQIIAAIDLQDCMTVKELKSPEYGDVFPVVVYNAAKNSEADNVCREQYPKLSRLKLNERKTLQGSTLRTIVMDPEFQKNYPNFVFTKGMEKQLVGWREIDGTCFLTAISTIAANIAERNNVTPLSPYALSAILEFFSDKRSQLLATTPDERVNIAARPDLPREISDYGILNRDPVDLINDQALAALGLQYRTVPVDKNVSRDAAGILLNRDNQDTTTHDPILWRNKGHVLTRQFLDSISKGEYPVYIAEVEPGIGHTTAVLGVEVGDNNKDSWLLVYEPANGGLDYFWSLTGGEGGWENVKDASGRSTGVMRIRLNEKNLRTFNQFPAATSTSADNYIPVLTEMQGTQFLSFMQQR